MRRPPFLASGMNLICRRLLSVATSPPVRIAKRYLPTRLCCYALVTHQALRPDNYDPPVVHTARILKQRAVVPEDGHELEYRRGRPGHPKTGYLGFGTGRQDTKKHQNSNRSNTVSDLNRAPGPASLRKKGQPCPGEARAG